MKKQEKPVVSDVREHVDMWEYLGVSPDDENQYDDECPFYPCDDVTCVCYEECQKRQKELES